MRYILLTIAILVMTPSLLLPPAQTQEPERPPPDIAKYTPAGENCKKKKKLDPWVGTPVGRCLMNVHTCDGLEKYGLTRETGDCDDFRKRADSLSKIEICCDQSSPEEEPPPKVERTPEKECAPPTPWFAGASGCKEFRNTQIVISGGTAINYMCGSAVFHYVVGNDDLFNTAYRAALEHQLQEQGVAKVCCDKFEDAVKTGKPCNPRLDVDCDGQSNSSDLTSDGSRPVIDATFTEPSETRAEFPPGMTVDAILPSDQCKGCRWELVKGELKCNPDPTKRHTYESTWRCATTGAVVQVDKLSTPGAPCPY